MGEEPVDDGSGQRGQHSRRAALRAGVGVGVGLIASSGPKITSLGGTPAYAVGCTFIVRIDLSGGCKNIDLGEDCDFAYHPLERRCAPVRIQRQLIRSLTASVANPLHHAHLPRRLHVRLDDPVQRASDCSGDLLGILRDGPESDGTLEILRLPPHTPAHDTQYQVFVTCNPTTAPPECLE